MRQTGPVVRRLGLLGIGILLVGASAYVLRPDPVPVDLGGVDWRSLTLSVREAGLTRIRERYAISTPLDGRLQRITLKVGDQVNADQTVIARLEPTLPTLLDPRAIAQIKARVQAAQRRVEVAKLRLESATVEARHAEAERARIYQLYQQDAVAEAERQHAELQARLSTDAQRAAQYDVEICEFELELERAALLITESSHEDSPADMLLTIRAPIDGRVLRMHQEHSAVIPAGTVLLEIGDPHDLEVVVDVLSRDAVKIQPGAAVTLHRWGGPQSLRGTVRYVEPSGYTKVSALGVEEQRVDVVIDFSDPPQQRAALGDAFRVEAEISLWHNPHVLTVPTAALFRSGEQWAAFVHADGRAQQQQVQLGQRNEQLAEVLDGLSPGVDVVLYPSEQIRTGTPIRSRSD